MKTQKLTLTLLILLITLSQILFTSCSSNKVVSSSFIQKRKYTNGYHFSLASKKAKKKPQEVIDKNSETDDVETTLVVNETTLTDNFCSNETESNGIDVKSFKVTPEYFNDMKTVVEMKTEKSGTVSSSGKNEVSRVAEEIKHAAVNKFNGVKESKNGNMKGLVLWAIAIGIFAMLFFMPFVGIVFGLMFGIAALCASGKKKGEKTETGSAKSKGLGWKILGYVLLTLLILFIFVMVLVLLFTMLFSGFSMSPMC